MSDLQRLIQDFKKFENKGVMQDFKREIRKPFPKIKAAIKASALAILPSRNGLNAWVADSKIGLRFKPKGIEIRGGRNSVAKRSAIKEIDRGNVRAPAWGKRKASWHNQTVASGFFTTPATETDEIQKAARSAIDKATEVLRNG